jgi:hypothetical protein
MKTSKLYIEAAKLIAEGKAYFGCTAIYMVKHKKPMSEAFFRINDPEALAVAYLFQNEKYNNTLYRGTFGNPRIKKNQDLRILALCFMAAMSEMEGF